MVKVAEKFRLRVRFPCEKRGVAIVLLPPEVTGQAPVSRFAAPWSTSSVLTRAEAGPAGNQARPAANPA